MYKKCEEVLNNLESKGKIRKLNFNFPPKQELKLKLKDLLEDEVDEKYYLSQKMMNYVLDMKGNQKGTKWEKRIDNECLNSKIAHSLSVRSAGGCQRLGVSNFVVDLKEIKVKDLKALNEVVRLYGIFDTKDKKRQAGSVYDQNGLSPTLTTMEGGWRQPCIEDFFKIRKLTPKECWRLMGFSNDDFEKTKKVNSDTQLYKQAGNSIVVNVLVEIFKNLFNLEKSDNKRYKQTTIYDYLER